MTAAVSCAAPSRARQAEAGPAQSGLVESVVSIPVSKIRGQLSGVSGLFPVAAITPSPRPEPPVLEMRPACERCAAPLPRGAAAFICSYECTFCPACSQAMDGTCSNCQGELMARPRRLPSADPA